MSEPIGGLRVRNSFGIEDLTRLLARTVLLAQASGREAVEFTGAIRGTSGSKRDPLPVLRDRHPIAHPRGFQLKRQIVASEQAVVDGFHVDSDDLGSGSFAGRNDVIG